METAKDKKTIYDKLGKDLIFSDEDCELLAFYESLKSREDSDHQKGSDPLVGAVVRGKDGHILAYSHRANSFEGEHAEFSILKGQLYGFDLSDCDFFTTLEPCVDSVRKKVGSSCSNLLVSSGVRRIHIGILDSSNQKVFGKGLETLFSGGKTIIPFSDKVSRMIENSWPGFTKPSSKEMANIERIKNEVFCKFQDGALEKYLTDKFNFEKTVESETELSESFDLEKEINKIALVFIRSGLVSFDAKKTDVLQDIKIMFYSNEYLATSSRQVKVRYMDGNESKDEVISDALPLAYYRLMELYDKSFNLGSMMKSEYREAVVNALIHSDYGPDAPLIYLVKEKGLLSIKNKASDNIPLSELEKLKTFDSDSYPGNGFLASLFNASGYCEHDNKGLSTFKESNPRPSFTIDNRLVTLTFKTI